MELPQFSGKVKDYLEFREVFRSLVAEIYTEHMLYITQLKNQLPTDGKNMLRGIVHRNEAWEVLKRQYDDRNAAVATILSGLQHLKFSGSSSHDKLEALAQAVLQAMISLSMWERKVS